MATEKTNKKAEDTALPTEEVTVAPVVSAPVASDIEVPKMDELEKENRMHTIEAEREAPKPKLVDLSNGTQSFVDSRIEKVTNPQVVQGVPAMDNGDPTKLVYIDNVETPVVQRETRVIDERLKKADFKRVMDDMEKSNPTKFAAQKADLQKQMDAAPE